MTLFIQIIAGIAIAFLKVLLSRRDLMEKGQAIQYEAALRHAERALNWKATSAITPDRGATLGVRADAAPITLPSCLTHPESGTSTDSVLQP